MSEAPGQAYEAPTIEVVGTLRESTLGRDKNYGKPSDGDVFLGKVLYTVGYS